MFTKRQESELITAIQGRGEIPLKFAYLGKGAQAFDKIAKYRSVDGKGINSRESDLLTNRTSAFLNTFKDAKKINIIDIGCGNGMPVFPILDELMTRGVSFRYMPVDISKQMIELATRNIKKRYKKIRTKPYVIDFELGNFSDLAYKAKQDGSINLLLFLGTTLGNHSDRHRILTNFRDSMTSSDYLIVGVELTDYFKINKILPYYSEKAQGDLLYLVPKHIGIERKNTKYDVSWNENLSQVEVRLNILKNIPVRIGKETFSLEKGEQLLIERSVKFAEWSFTKLFSDVGFRTELLTTSRDRSYVLSMTQPTRYSN